MMSKKTKKWLKAAGIRAAKTVAQTAVALLPAAATLSQVDWMTVAGTAAPVSYTHLDVYKRQPVCFY